MDALVLAGLADIPPSGRVLDLGTGCGVVALILAHRHPEITVFGVEIQKSLATVASSNVRENLLSHRVTILHQDMAALSPAATSGTVDTVICNPPHIEQFRGRINPDPAAAIARHEIKITLRDIISISAKMLSPMGQMQIIYPPARVPELMSRMRAVDIEPRQLIAIYSKPDTPARRVLVKGVKGGRSGLDIPPPFVIYNRKGGYSNAARRIFEMDAASSADGEDKDFLFDTPG